MGFPFRKALMLEVPGASRAVLALVLLPGLLFVLPLKIHVLTQFIGALSYPHSSRRRPDGCCMLTSHTGKISFMAKEYA